MGDGVADEDTTSAETLLEEPGLRGHSEDPIPVIMPSTPTAWESEPASNATEISPNWSDVEASLYAEARATPEWGGGGQGFLSQGSVCRQLV